MSGIRFYQMSPYSRSLYLDQRGEGQAPKDTYIYQSQYDSLHLKPYQDSSAHGSKRGPARKFAAFSSHRTTCPEQKAQGRVEMLAPPRRRKGRPIYPFELPIRQIPSDISLHPSRHATDIALQNSLQAKTSLFNTPTPPLSDAIPPRHRHTQKENPQTRHTFANRLTFTASTLQNYPIR